MGLNFVQASIGAFLGAHLKRALCISAALGTLTGVGVQAHAADTVTHWIMPDIDIPEADRPQYPSIFGTIALPLSARPTSTRWSKLMQASLAQPALASLTESIRELPPEEQAAFVQVAINQAVHTRPASYDCSDDGYWAPAGETLTRGMGDCFDIAIAKMEALRFLGIPNKDLYLTTGRFLADSETGKGRESVALLVRIGERFWLMTEQSDQIIEEGNSLDSVIHFSPVLTYGVGMTWLHGRMLELAAVAD